ncbi:MAG: glycosyltransferase family 4 protein [Patescibacteria group bacterium]|nr:glycosyltransferase family 4 protein [Patescibacteria group bacterium]
MKIGIFDPYLDTLGGGEKYMLTAAQCLSKRHRVSVFWDSKDVLDQAQERFGLDLSRVASVKNIFSPSVSFLSRLLVSARYDAIVYLSDGTIPVVLSRKLYVHAQFPMPWINGNSLVTKLKMLRVTKIICNSAFTKKHIDKNFDTNSVIAYPPATGEFPKFPMQKTNTILSVGRFGYVEEGKTFKKQEEMIKAFKRMVDNGLKQWKLILVVSFRREDKERTKFLFDAVKGYPIDIRTNVGFEDLHKLYATARIYWHATGFGEDLEKYPERAEHFGIATVQAMEQGVVPVVIDAGGQPEIVRDGENGLLWKTEEALISQTEKLIKDQKLWKSLSEHARQSVSQFSIEAFCKQILSIVK